MEYPIGATPLDPDEMAGLLILAVETRADLDEVEQTNIQAGFKWLAKQRKYSGLDCLSMEFARELHQQLFGQVWSWAGQFRLTEKNIGIDPRHIATQLMNALADAQVWHEQSTYSRLEYAARLHHKLVFIHPFANGNGRWARILTDVVLEQVLATEPIDWGRGLLSISEHRRNYLDALRAADRQDFSLLKAFMSE